MKTTLMLVSLLALCGVVWTVTAGWPDESYERGYAAAFAPADAAWMTQLPPPHICEDLAATESRRDPTLTFGWIVDGCRHGYYDAVSAARGRLGWPMTEPAP